MEIDWDKEFDALLRREGKDESLNSAKGFSALENPLFDEFEADEINAFIENTLPPKARARMATKLADSERGRAILANLILINEADETEENKAISNSTTPIKVVEKSSWSDFLASIFTPKMLGLAGASLAVILVGTFAFVVLSPNKSSEIALISKNESESAKSAAPAPLTNSNMAATASNTASVASNTASVAAPSMSNAASTAADMSANTASPATAKELPKTPATPIIENKNKPLEPAREETDDNAKTKLDDAKPAERDEPKTEGETAAVPLPAPIAAPPTNPAKPKMSKRADPEVREKQADITTDGVAQNKDEAKKAGEDKTTAAGSASTQNQLPGIVRKGPMQNNRREGGNNADVALSSEQSPTRQIGGKSFTKRGNTWTDAAYGSQKVKKVSRGSKDYRKLDAGLRSIAESLAGEVLVVWNGKAYRIN